jgi:CheY-like chemotaxis protein
MSRILLVDDELEIVTLTKMMLEKRGYEVAVANSGNRCMEILKKNDRPDLILLDVMMPDEDGWEVCRKIKGDESTRDIPIAMFTVSTGKEKMKKSLEYAHADALICKPFDMNRLCNTVEDILENHVMGGHTESQT